MLISTTTYEHNFDLTINDKRFLTYLFILLYTILVTVLEAGIKFATYNIVMLLSLTL